MSASEAGSTSKLIHPIYLIFDVLYILPWVILYVLWA